MSLLLAACQQADGLLQLHTNAAGRCRLSGGVVASPVCLTRSFLPSLPPQAAAESLCSRLDLSGSWFSSVSACRGYVNFTLAPAWYAALCHETPAWTAAFDLPAPLPPSAATIHPADWQVLCLLEHPDAALAARQDSANPGWLLRYTARRLERFSGTDGPEIWEYSLLEEFSSWSQRVQPKQQLLWLVSCCKTLWKGSPQRHSGQCNRYFAQLLKGVLSALEQG